MKCMYNLFMLDSVAENSSQKETEKFVKSEKILPGSGGWLSPGGNYYPTKSTEHDEAAEWIIENNLSEIPNREQMRGYRRTDSEFREKSGLNPRQFLNKKRWILINGPIFRTFDALNYTTKQLEMLAEAGIPVIGVYDGSKEFSTEETLKWVGDVVRRVNESLVNGDFTTWKPEKLAFEKGKIVNLDEYWGEIHRSGYKIIEDFAKDPFHTEFGDFGRIHFTDVRDRITEGYKDEIVFDKDRETYTIRLIELESGEKIAVEYTFHHHDRDSGNEEHMNIYVVDDFTFKDKIKKYLSAGSQLVIKTEPQFKGEYFRKIVENR